MNEVRYKLILIQVYEAFMGMGFTFHRSFVTWAERLYFIVLFTISTAIITNSVVL